MVLHRVVRREEFRQPRIDGGGVDDRDLRPESAQLGVVVKHGGLVLVVLALEERRANPGLQEEKMHELSQLR